MIRLVEVVEVWRSGLKGKQILEGNILLEVELVRAEKISGEG